MCGGGGGGEALTICTEISAVKIFRKIGIFCFYSLISLYFRKIKQFRRPLVSGFT